MSGHTPGPWVEGEATFVRPPEAGSQVIVVAAKGVEGRDPGEPLYVCMTGRMSDPQGRIEQSWADARLIAAAPDLLDALEALLDGWLPEGPRLDDVVFARAAIAKAKGGIP